MEHCPRPKYGMIYRPDMHNLQIRKKHLKNKQELKFIFQIMPLLNNYQISTLPKNKRWPEMNSRLVQFKD